MTTKHLYITIPIPFTVKYDKPMLYFWTSFTAKNVKLTLILKVNFIEYNMTRSVVYFMTDLNAKPLLLS